MKLLEKKGLFGVVEQMHGDVPWGHFLDAGTGRMSARWGMSISTESWSGITGSELMSRDVYDQIGSALREQDRVIVGNWIDPNLLAEEQFDVVLADYLLGAMDGFAPYWQDRLFSRLRSLVKKRLYIIGLAPYVNEFPKDLAGSIICEIGRLRDACLLLADERPYREYPVDWVLRHLRLADFKIMDMQKFSIRYDQRFIKNQLAMCQGRMARIKNRALAASMLEHIEDLRSRATILCEAQKGLSYGHDYVISAMPV